MSFYDKAIQSSREFDFDDFFNAGINSSGKHALSITSDWHTKDLCDYQAFEIMRERHPKEIINIHHIGNRGNPLELVRAYPRDVAWKEFPISFPPHYKAAGVLRAAAFSQTPHQSKPKRGDEVSFGELMTVVDAVFVRYTPTRLSTEFDAYQFYHKVYTMLSQLGWNKEISIRQNEGDYYIVDMPRLREAASPIASFERFHHEYAFNIQAILGKAYKRIVPVSGKRDTTIINELQIGLSSRHIPPQVWPDKLPKSLYDPFALQILFYVRKSAGRDIKVSSQPNYWTSHTAISTSLFSAVVSDRTRKYYWEGTGKYDKVSVNLINNAGIKLIEDGLLTLDGELKKIILTDVAAELLRCVHPDCEDPDIMNRWPTISTDPKVEVSRKDWIQRHFRKMKAYLETGGGGSKWKV